MSDAPVDLADPALQRLLKSRSRWRWGLALSLVGSYLVYVVAGIYVPELYATRFAGTAIPWGVILGYLIILMSIVMSVVYVRVVGKLKAGHAGTEDGGQ